MTKTPQWAAVAALVVLWAITAYAVAGPHPLPARIPVHFDLEGHPNAWGSPAVLWLMPVIATALFFLLGFVARHPEWFNYPVRPTPATRPVLEVLSIRMLAWLRLELVVLFAAIQFGTLHGIETQSQLSAWIIAIGVGSVWATVGWFIVALRRVGKTVQTAGKTRL